MCLQACGVHREELFIWCLTSFHVTARHSRSYLQNKWRHLSFCSRNCCSAPFLQELPLSDLFCSGCWGEIRPTPGSIILQELWPQRTFRGRETINMQGTEMVDGSEGCWVPLCSLSCFDELRMLIPVDAVSTRIALSCRSALWRNYRKRGISSSKHLHNLPITCF